MSSERSKSVTERLPAFLAGASAGLLVAWLVARQRQTNAAPAPAAGDRGAPPPMERARAAGRWAETWEDAMETITSARERLLRPVLEVELAELRRRLADMPGGEDLEVRALGDGIVEVVGHAADPATAQRALDMLADAPGVDIVVNRVWTPASLGLTEPEAGPSREG